MGFKKDLLFFQIIVRYFILISFVNPIYVDDPPTISIIQQLYTVDSSHKRKRVFLRFKRFIGAKNMGNISKYFSFPANFFFVEAIFFQPFSRGLDVIIS